MRSLTIEDLYAIKFLSRPRISPDGQQVAYVVNTIDASEHQYRSTIWVAPTGKSETRPVPLATGTSPSWSPDGRWLAFVAERSGEGSRAKEKPQIWLFAINSGETRQLTFMKHGASDPSWSPDSKQILFSAPVGPEDEKTPEGQLLPKVRVINQLSYRKDGIGFTYERRSHLFLLDIANGQPQQLTDGDYDDSNATWSPDSKYIAFLSNRNEDRWHSLGDDLYILTLKNNPSEAPRRLTDGSKSCVSLSWSPDSQTIAFIAAPKHHAAEYYHLFTVTIHEPQPLLTCLTQGFEGSCMDLTNSDIGDEQLAPAPVWAADSKTLYALAARRGVTHLYAFPSKDQNNQPITLTPGNIHIRDFSFDQAKSQLAVLAADPQHPQEIWVYPLSTEASLRDQMRNRFQEYCVSSSNIDFGDKLSLSQPEAITFAGADGWPIEGWIVKPTNFDADKKYPLIVEIHGGPHSQYGSGFFHEMQLLAAQGYIVFYCNPHGSVGYGYEFANAVRRDWGEKPMLDIQLGIDEVLCRGYIDEKRLGVIGGSYGGFLVNWLVGHTGRFKVAITDRSVSNMVSMFGACDIGWDFMKDHMEAVPWENLDRYLQQSPLTYVQNIHTPLLIIHSEQDLRCNIEQAQQLFTALKYLGRDVQLVLFEGQSHGLSRSGHPKLRLERLRHITRWFGKYLS